MPPTSCSATWNAASMIRRAAMQWRAKASTPHRRPARRCASAGISAVGIANNVNYGEAAITSSIARLDELGIPHTGAGSNAAAARAPIIVERNGIRYGFLQRSSVYWPTNHEAGANSTGIAVIRAHTAYQVPMHKTRREIPPINRPGIPPVIITWADPDSSGRLHRRYGSVACECGHRGGVVPLGPAQGRARSTCARSAMPRSMPAPTS